MELIQQYSSSEESDEESLNRNVTDIPLNQELENHPVTLEIFSEKHHTTMSQSWGTILLSVWRAPPLAKTKLKQACHRVLEQLPAIAQNYKVEPLYNETFRGYSQTPIHISYSLPLFINNRDSNLAKQILSEETKRLKIPSSLVHQEAVDKSNPLSSILQKNPKKVVRLKFDKKMLLLPGDRGFNNQIYLCARIQQTPDTREFFQAIDDGILRRLFAECDVEAFGTKTKGLEHISILKGRVITKPFSEESLKQLSEQLEQIDLSDLLGDINVDLDRIELDTGASTTEVQARLFT
ncbi:uncharacterized protein SPAPADRAFT_49031 [Spathaspora passalidarum NRRL Y-27907]|uniref:U6 snRNA phosphodiesterase n=1 Tax=Spathaspora passalidarum (strain NRRL Y-27907 / 11-Y1) TaxID=619300 RepID=G3AJN8_SPAPN|nr:uncharacterized protein SPAPADRAFT_49031 [Spathaspora passalidarum NRRL Y-27907]EGW33939.1 hypothetical protein SPAPADRAFT_49031 [Spathaspora passalidarum NRRL Y-27907]